MELGSLVVPFALFLGGVMGSLVKQPTQKGVPLMQYGHWATKCAKGLHQGRGWQGMRASGTYTYPLRDVFLNPKP